MTVEKSLGNNIETLRLSTDQETHYARLGDVSDVNERVEVETVAEFPLVDSNAAEIRILLLHPSDDAHSPIKCSYQVRSLNESEFSYETLSYAWRDHSSNDEAEPMSPISLPLPARAILIDDRPFPVSATVYSALQQLRPRSPSANSRALWIDAVCINQADDQEKTAQVDLMHRIYTGCTGCVIWLGTLPPSVDARSARDALDVIAWCAREDAPTPDWVNGDEEEDWARGERAARALKTMMGLPWWSRIWTVQEALLPPRAVLVWGEAELRWEDVQSTAQRLSEGKWAEGWLHPEFDAGGSLNDLCCNVNGLRFSRHESLCHLLWRWRFRGATDQRDKVYALMGLRRELPGMGARSCDYTLDVVTLFTRITADLINLNHDLEPLIGRRGEAPTHKGLPSWAVDWTHPEPGGCSEFWLHSNRYHFLDYATDRGLFGVGEGLRMADERTLILTGLHIDKIAVVENRENVPNSSLSGWRLIGANLDRFGDLLNGYLAWTIANGRESRIPSGWMGSVLGLVRGNLIPNDPDHGENPGTWIREIVLPQVAFITESGRVGVGPMNLQPGHELWAIGGSRFPMILSSTGNSDEDGVSRDFLFVGDCFVHGIMRGEALENSQTSPVDIRLH